MAVQVTRFAFTLEHEKGRGAPLVLPLRGDPSRSTVGDLVRSLERRLERKFSPQKPPSVRQLLLADGDALDPQLNDDDSLDCFWAGSETHHVTVCLFAAEPTKAVHTCPTIAPFLPAIAASVRPAASSTPSPDTSPVDRAPRAPDGDNGPGSSVGSPASSRSGGQTGKSRRWRELSGERRALNAAGEPRPSESGNHGHQGQAAVPPAASPNCDAIAALRRPLPVVARVPQPPPAPPPWPPEQSVQQPQPSPPQWRQQHSSAQRREEQEQPQPQQQQPQQCVCAPTPPRARGPVRPPSGGSPPQHAPQPPPPASAAAGALSGRAPQRQGARLHSAPGRAERAALAKQLAAQPREQQRAAAAAPPEPSTETPEQAAARERKVAELQRWGDMVWRELHFDQGCDRTLVEQDEARGRLGLRGARQQGIDAHDAVVRRHRQELEDLAQRQATLQRSVESGARKELEAAEQDVRARLRDSFASVKAGIFSLLALSGREAAGREGLEADECYARRRESQREAAAAAWICSAVLAEERESCRHDEAAGRDGLQREAAREWGNLATDERAAHWRVQLADAARDAVRDSESSGRCSLSAAESVEGGALRDAAVDGALAIRLREDAIREAQVKALFGEELRGREALTATELQKRQMYARLEAEAYARTASGDAPPRTAFSPPRAPPPAICAPPQQSRVSTAPTQASARSARSSATSAPGTALSSGPPSAAGWDGPLLPLVFRDGCASVGVSWDSGCGGGGPAPSSRLRSSLSRGSTAATDDQEMRKSVTFRSPLRQVFTPTPDNSAQLTDDDLYGPAPPQSDPID
eukprot:TRINITY_DN8703_c1_g1_i1.p1 TRINITY_DN8703_c1_g1~~TRINITY_DN8703_c1_g1_i1.p1  ORF type:complete len:814 (+),score=229.79 TRINITY_DN8703_c1_g1_i1:90-2531(+)